MKFLLIMLFTLNTFAAERVVIRKCNKRLEEIKLMDSTHCDELGAFKAMCVKDFNLKMGNKIRKINTARIEDHDTKAMGTVSAMIMEENLIVEYKAYLDTYTIAYTDKDDSTMLKVKVDAHKEATCVTDKRAYIDDNCTDILTYMMTDTCSQLIINLEKVDQCIVIE